MKRALLLLLLFFVVGSVKAQDTLQESKSVITLSLGTPTVSYAPRYNVGYMHKVARRWWAGTALGYGNYTSSFGMSVTSDRINNDYKIFEVRPEIFFDLRPSSKLKHLVSAEFFYINHKDRFTTDRYFANEGITEYKFDAADYKRIKAGVNINYSLMFYFAERLGLIWKAGFGIANRNVKYSNFTNRREVDNSGGSSYEGNILGTDQYIDFSGTRTKFNFDLDLKLFYKF
jgi:hypothetical protein